MWTDPNPVAKLALCAGAVVKARIERHPQVGVVVHYGVKAEWEAIVQGSWGDCFVSLKVSASPGISESDCISDKRNTTPNRPRSCWNTDSFVQQSVRHTWPHQLSQTFQKRQLEFRFNSSSVCLQTSMAAKLDPNPHKTHHRSKPPEILSVLSESQEMTSHSLKYHSNHCLVRTMHIRNRPLITV